LSCAVSVLIRVAAGRLHHSFCGWGRGNLLSHCCVHRSFDIKSWRIANVIERHVYEKIDLRSSLYRVIGIDEESRLLNFDLPVADPSTLLRLKLSLKVAIGSPCGPQAAKSEDRQNNGGNHPDAFQYRSYPFPAIAFASLALLGFVVFGYFYWQAHYCFKFSLTTFLLLAGVSLFAGGYSFYKAVQCFLDSSEPSDEGCVQVSHARNTVPQKYILTSPIYWGTVIGIGRTDMPNILAIEKQATIIGALAEGSGIRQIERMTGVHRDTIMRLGVRVGKGCANLLDQKMRGLTCQQLQFDEIWGFIGKKERHILPEDSRELGDVWTFCAIDADTKLVPSFKVGKRDAATANAFVADVAGRVRNRVQISSDALRAYVEAVELAFGANVDFAQIVKTYVNDGSQIAERKYSASEFVIAEKNAITGHPNMSLASTSYVERLNGTTRLHMRRLTRLTYAFSKKLENFEAAVALHFAYYNFVKRHNTLRATPAMAAGIERDFWTVGDLLEATA